MRIMRIPGWLLFVAFIVVPLVEIFVLIQVGQVIGAWWTIALLIADSIFGTWLIKREGARSWAALRDSLQTGRMPARELADAGLIVVGGTLMLTPGFVTDILALFLILPFTRPVARRVLTRVVANRLIGPIGGPGGPGGSGGSGGFPRNARRPGPGPEGPVVQGEVVDDD
jgi:UPF0716 protein FxsA